MSDYQSSSQCESLDYRFDQTLFYPKTPEYSPCPPPCAPSSPAYSPALDTQCYESPSYQSPKQEELVIDQFVPIDDNDNRSIEEIFGPYLDARLGLVGVPVGINGNLCPSVEHPCGSADECGCITWRYILCEQGFDNTKRLIEKEKQEREANARWLANRMRAYFVKGAYQDIKHPTLCDHCDRRIPKLRDRSKPYRKRRNSTSD